MTITSGASSTILGAESVTLSGKGVRIISPCRLVILQTGLVRVIFLASCHSLEYFQVTFHGKYDDRECGISFIATDEDTGVWR